MMKRKVKTPVADKEMVCERTPEEALIHEYGRLAAERLLNVFYDDDFGEVIFEINVGGYERVSVAYNPPEHTLRIRAEPKLRKLSSTVLSTFGREPIDATLQIGCDAYPLDARTEDGLLVIKVAAKWRNQTCDEAGFYDLEVYNADW